MKNLPLLLLAGLLAHTAHAQKRTQDVIHLKNGSIIRNASGLKHLDSLIEVQTKDGSTIRFAASDLERIVREPVKPDFRTKGYFVGMEAGFGFGKTYESRNGQSAQATQKLQVQVVNGYWFTPRWAATVRKPTTIGATILKAEPKAMLFSGGCRCGSAGLDFLSGKLHHSGASIRNLLRYTSQAAAFHQKNKMQSEAG